MISHSELTRLLDYDPETRVFTWLVRCGKAQAGDRAGSPFKDTAHRRIQINYRSYKEHRLAWFYVHSEWPEGDLDHEDRDASNNRIKNLRPATPAQNAANKASRNPFGKGVQFSPRHKSKPYFSVLETRVNGKRVCRYLGHFATAEEARLAYASASLGKHGEFFCP